VFSQLYLERRSSVVYLEQDICAVCSSDNVALEWNDDKKMLDRSLNVNTTDANKLNVKFEDSISLPFPRVNECVVNSSLSEHHNRLSSTLKHAHATAVYLFGFVIKRL
jgi:hypothetical protein